MPCPDSPPNQIAKITTKTVKIIEDKEIYSSSDFFPNIWFYKMFIIPLFVLLRLLF